MMNRSDSEKLSVLLLQLNALMDQSVLFVQEKGDEKEFLSYRRKAAEVMGGLCDAMNSIHAKYPDLQPIELGGTYVIDKAIYSQRFYGPTDPTAV
jgi:hypothetical protein